MKKKIVSIFLLTILLVSLTLNLPTAAEELEVIDDIEEIEEGFVPVVDQPDEKNDFEINPDLPVVFEPEYEMEYALPELSENAMDDDLQKEIEKNDAKMAFLEKHQEHPLTRIKMLSVFIPPLFTPIEAQSFSGPSIGGFSNTGVNFNIYDNSKGDNKITYVNSKRSYNPDAAVLDYRDGRYRIVIAGVDGWIDEAAIQYFKMNQIQSLSHYYVDGKGDLIHALTKGPHTQSYSALNNGPAPSYLKRNVHYYSYDGHYFYTNISTMLNDYKNNTRKNSVNPNLPFFNYFQFLPYRTKSSITASNLDAYLAQKGYNQQVAAKYKDSAQADVPKNQSKLVGQSHHFINQMNKYGANGAMTFAVAVHESDWGRSTLARGRNNLFGHKAYDAYPGAADSYQSISDAIHSHNTRFINWHYLDYTDKSGHYQGGMLGNKLSGINVHYASDAYWGEKIAAHYLNLDRATGSKDYQKYKIAYKNDNQQVNLRKGPSTKDPKILTADHKHQTFVIYDTVEGEYVDGNNIWYKVSSDHILTKNRDFYHWQGHDKSREVGYLLDESYVYVHSNYVTPVGEIPVEEKPVEEKPVEETPPQTSIAKGDVNGDGKIDGFDMMAIKRHYLGIKKLTGEKAQAADVNGDGKIDGFDMMAIKRHYLGIRKIEG